MSPKWYHTLQCFQWGQMHVNLIININLLMWVLQSVARNITKTKSIKWWYTIILLEFKTYITLWIYGKKIIKCMSLRYSDLLCLVLVFGRQELLINFPISILVGVNNIWELSVLLMEFIKQSTCAWCCSSNQYQYFLNQIGDVCFCSWIFWSEKQWMAPAQATTFCLIFLNSKLSINTHIRKCNVKLVFWERFSRKFGYIR